MKKRVKMKLFFILALSTTLTFLNADDSKEPKLGFTLKIDNKVIKLEENKAVKLKGISENPTVTLVPDKYRYFTYAGLKFYYPSNMAFEADFSEQNLKMWTLDGSDFVLSVHHYLNLTITAKSLAAQLKAYYGKKTTTAPISYTFNGVKYSGIRVRATIAGSGIIQDVLELPAKNGSRILILQDAIASEKVSEDERNLILGLLKKSFKATP